MSEQKRLVKLMTPNGVPIESVVERVLCVTPLDEEGPGRDPETGEFDLDARFMGGTNVDWGTQEPIREDGERVFLDADENRWAESQIVEVPIEKEPDPPTSPWRPVELVFIRPGEGETVEQLVLLRFQTNVDLPNAKVLSHVVGKWLRETAEGLEAWEESSGDFNIGDFMGYDMSNDLWEPRGIRDIAASQLTDDDQGITSLSYDLVLGSEGGSEEE